VEPLRHDNDRAVPVSSASRPRAAFGALLAIAAVVTAIDQLSKAIVVSALGNGRVVDLPGSVVRLVYARNTGAAFGIFPDRGTLFAIVAGIVVAGILLSYRRLSQSPIVVRAAAGLLLGGAIGNLLDRVRLGYVVDFIDLGWFPVFNLADSSIVLGVAALFLFTALQQDRQQ